MAEVNTALPRPPETDDGANLRQWLTRVWLLLRTGATATAPGFVKQSTAIADLDQTISATPTQAEVQAISDKLDAMLASDRASGQRAT